MATWATLAELKARYGELAGLAEDAALQQALAAAQAEVESYVGARFQLPLPPDVETPPLLKELVMVLARHRAYTEQPTDAIEREAVRARVTLRDISAARVALPLPGSSAQPKPRGLAQTAAPTKRWSSGGGNW